MVITWFYFVVLFAVYWKGFVGAKDYKGWQFHLLYFILCKKILKFSFCVIELMIYLGYLRVEIMSLNLLWSLMS